jgi:hypothetical protein
MGREGDLLAAHAGDLVDLLAEVWRLGVERDQLVDEPLDLLLERRLLLRLDRDEAGRLLGHDHRHRIGRGQLEFGRRGLGRGLVGRRH